MYTQAAASYSLNHQHFYSSNCFSKKSTKKRYEILRQRKIRTLILSILTFTMVMVWILSAFTSRANENKKSYKYYTSIEVNTGDSLWTIAGEHMGTTFESKKEYINEVKEINHLTDDKITAGEQLIVPYYSHEKH